MNDRQLRLKKLNISIETLAKRAKISEVTTGKWVRYKSVTMSSQEKILTALNEIRLELIDKRSNLNIKHTY